MKSVGPLRVSVIQAPLEWADKEKNLEYFSRELESFHEQTDLLVLPEMFATGFITESRQIADPMDGRVMQWMEAQARKLTCVVTGSIAIIEEDKIYNRLVWMRPDGSYETTDKRHLFRMANEHHHYTAGDTPLVVELKGWKIRPLVCYDLRFPVWSKNKYHSGNYDYDMLIYVANWPTVRNHAWKSLLVARSIENQVYCVGVNRIGNDGRGFPHSGDSVVLDFKGQPLLTIPEDKPALETISLDYQELELFRERFTVGLDWDEFSIEGL